MSAAPGDAEFDYVVVGAGTGGCVLANRLSADPNVRVALLEAGPPDTHPWIHIPAAVGAAIVTPQIGWGYWTAPQAHMGGRKIPVPRGRVLGGSSSINGMVYNRGHPKDYDDWAAMGNKGWSYLEVLPYFRRSEDNPRFAGSPYHGVGGEMHVSDIRKTNPLNPAFFQAMEELQIRRCPDYNSLNPEGYGLRQAAIRNGRPRVRLHGVPQARHEPSEPQHHLQCARPPCRDRGPQGHGRRGRGAGRRAGDQGAARGHPLRRGHRLAALLLLLSGIGDGEALKALGMEVEHHLPAVGQNLHDHLAVLVQMLTPRDSTSYGISAKAFPRGVWNVLEYLLWRQGPLASFVFEANAFVRTTPELDRPDVQMVFQPARRNQNTFPIPVGHGYVMSSVLLYPKSRGRIALASPDPETAPIIDPNLLAEPEDYEPLLRALALSRRVFASPAFARYRAEEFKPGPEITTREGLMAHIRDTGSTVHHPCGSCRMGGDDASVVDPELKVRGVEGLRVADASIFPRLVGGNTNAVVVMVAEKAADMILGRPAPAPADLAELQAVEAAR